MVLSLMTFGTFTASADTSFVDYVFYNDLDVQSDDGLYDIFGAGSRYGSDYLFTPVKVIDGAAHYVNSSGNSTTTNPSVLYYKIDIEGKTEPIVVDYWATMKGGSVYYVPQVSYNVTQSAIIAPNTLNAERAFLSYSATATSGYKMSSSHDMYLTDNTAHYQFVINPEAMTVTPYKDGVASSNVKSIKEGETSVYLAHAFNSYYKSNDNENITGNKYFALHYMSAYNDAATPDFDIVEYTTTGATVQFNTPVTADVAAAITVDGVAVASASDVSKADDQVNTYDLVFASELTEGVHTISATGTSLTGKTINASKSIGEPVDTSLVKPLSVGGVVLNSVENAFVKDGDFITLKETNGAFSLEDDGSLRFEQSSGVGDGRFKTIPLNPNGTDTGKLVLDFDVTSNRSTTGFYLKHGVTGTTNSALYGGTFPKGQGRVVNFKVIIDYDTQTYSLYIDGVKTEVVDNETKTYFTGKTAALLIYFTNVNTDADGNIGYASVENFAAYKIPSSTLEYEVVESVAKDGGKAVQFTMPVDTAASVATINGKQYGLVNAHESGSVNAYAVDTADLDAGTYDVTLNAKALEDSTKTATVNFQITLTGDKVIFTNSSATIDEELSGRVTVTAENNRNSEIRPMLLVAEYDSQDVFDDVDSVRTYINAYDTVVLSGKNNVNEGSYIKGYIWDSVTSAKPYCAAIEQ